MLSLMILGIRMNNEEIRNIIDSIIDDVLDIRYADVLTSPSKIITLSDKALDKLYGLMLSLKESEL